MHGMLQRAFSLLALLLLGLLSPTAFATTVRMQTSMGVIDIQLMDAVAPATVANFLAYVNSGAYVNSFIHRSVPGFIIQGGGYSWNNVTNGVATVPANAPVVNEFSASRSNLRGTIAMAKLGGDANSATNQWFFNLADNSANLDGQNGGFTVFGQVTGNGMQVVDAIAGLPIVNANGTSTSGPFGSLPLITVPIGGIAAQNLVIIGAVTVLPELTLVPGWNLLGNGLDQVLVVATFGDSNVVNAVWKWDAAASRWLFYSPLLDAAALQTYATGKGYGVLSQITPGEGYWVNAKVAAQLTAQTGSAFVLSAANLVTGWNLVATGQEITPAAFNQSLSATPPAPGTVPQNLTSLWAWDNPANGWYFYAPALEANNGLAAYIASKGYLDFTQHNKTLGNGTGFWVNRP
jgi:cyclophilin family peptidyl-prolyl cis-trans isomerase